VDQEDLSFLTRVNEFLICYEVAMGVLDAFLHVCYSIFPLCINLGYGVSKRSVGLFRREIPGISSAGVF